MLALTNIQSELQSKHSGLATAGAAPALTASTMISDWDARSLALVAQLTAPLRLRANRRPALLG